MVSPSRAPLPPRLLALALLAAGCAAPGPVREAEPRRYQSPTADAFPEADPTSRGMVQGPRFLTEVEQVVVRMGRAPDGRVVVLSVVSPQLTAEQQQEVARAFELGAWRREVPLPAAGESWIETIVRVK
ncbi:MAG: hypothetical protein IPO09_21695 [Anaeromyxobacter sp.]|nr:hypothetical protein [Anaeromyxobacter sp.]MBL0274624.1 hypothetical protein [Anaeromyxobacter sp.]